MSDVHPTGAGLRAIDVIEVARGGASVRLAGAYVELVCDEMFAACAPHACWIDVLCEEGAFDADQSRAVLQAGRAAGRGLRVHANQLGFGPGVKLGAASIDHCTFPRGPPRPDRRAATV